MRKYSPFAACLVAAAIVQPVAAKDVQKGPIKIESAWTRATPGGAKVAGGFVKITNTGSTPDRLIAASSNFSGAAEIHEMKMVDGVMKMRSLEKGIELPPGQTVELKPGGYHLMFIDLKAPIVQDKPVTAKLGFEKAGEVEVQFSVAPVGAKSRSGGKDAGGGHHKH